jgi:hypothetical protein
MDVSVSVDGQGLFEHLPTLVIYARFLYLNLSFISILVVVVFFLIAVERRHYLCHIQFPPSNLKKLPAGANEEK